MNPLPRPRRQRHDLTPLVGTPVTVETDDGARLHVEVDEAEPRRGSPLTVVLVHGYGLSAHSWHFQRRALRGRHRLVLPDLRGHGRSGRGPGGPIVVQRLADDLGQVLDAVVPQGPVALIGHSLGGMTIMELAVRRPDLLDRIEAVGLIATSPGGLAAFDHGLPLLGRHLVRWAENALERGRRHVQVLERGRRAGAELEQRLLRRWNFATPVRPELIRAVGQMMAETPVDVIADLLPAFGTLDETAALPALAGRAVLVMSAERDLMVPPEHGRDIAAAIPGAEHVLLRASGHLVMMEHPALVTARLESLLTRAGLTPEPAAEPASGPAAVVVPVPRRRRNGWR